MNRRGNPIIAGTIRWLSRWAMGSSRPALVTHRDRPPRLTFRWVIEVCEGGQPPRNWARALGRSGWANTGPCQRGDHTAEYAVVRPGQKAGSNAVWPLCSATAGRRVNTWSLVGDGVLSASRVVLGVELDDLDVVAVGIDQGWRRARRLVPRVSRAMSLRGCRCAWRTCGRRRQGS